MAADPPRPDDSVTDDAGDDDAAAGADATSRGAAAEAIRQVARAAPEAGAPPAGTAVRDAGAEPQSPVDHAPEPESGAPPLPPAHDVRRRPAP